jgi:hypothetical protein
MPDIIVIDLHCGLGVYAAARSRALMAIGQGLPVYVG